MEFVKGLNSPGTRSNLQRPQRESEHLDSYWAVPAVL